MIGVFGVRGTCFVVVIGLAVIIGSIMITTAGEPELYIDSHYDGERVDSDTITVYGHVRGTGGAVVGLVTVNGDKATGDTEWSAEVSLHPGENTITVVATDDIGDSATRTITVIFVKPTPTPAEEPKLYIDSHYDGETVNSEEITVYGHVRGTGGAVVELVTVNGVKATGDTEWSAEVSLHPGENTITVVATDDIGNSITETITVIYETGAISVVSKPAGATIELETPDDSFVNIKTPHSFTNIAPGTCTIKLFHERYQDWSKDVEVMSGETTYVNASMIPMPTPSPSPSPTISPTPTPTPTPTPAPAPTQTPIKLGAISVTTSPIGADVYLDNIYEGLTHCTIKDVRPGDHILKLSLKNYQGWSDTVHVTAGETTPVNVTLAKCEEGYNDCYPPLGDCKTNIYEDNDNCGDCGKKCPDGYFCLMGWCVEDTTGNKKKLATYYYEEGNRLGAEKRYEEALHYLRNARDVCNDLNTDEICGIIEVYIKEIEKEKIIKEIIHLFVEVGTAVILAAFFGYFFDKYRRPKKVPLLVVVAGSMGVFIVAFCALRLWVLPLFY